MSWYEAATITMGVLSVIVVPLLVVLFRTTTRYTRHEDQLSELVKDVQILIDAKERVHAEMFATMRDDRAATDKRLRFLEQWVWRRQGMLGERGEGSGG